MTAQKDSVLFSRESLAGYDPDRLRDLVVLLVGDGALGQNVTVNLVLSGVGEIRHVDADLFESHNSTRSPFYAGPGTSKAKEVATRSAALSPTGKQRMRYAHSWIEDLGAGAFDGVGVVISAVDDAGARSYLADQTRLHAIPLVEGGFEGPNTTVSGYLNNPDDAENEPCWLCANPDTKGSSSCRFYADAVKSIGIVPAIQTAAAFLGAIMAETAIQLAHNVPTISDRSVDLNVRTGHSRVVKHARDPLCAGVHRSIRNVERIHVSPLDTVLDLRDSTAELVGDTFTLQLPFTYVLDIPCTACERMTRPLRPLRTWLRGDRRCVKCGGPIAVAPKGTHVPRIYSALSSDLPTELGTLTLASLGLSYASIVEVQRDALDPLALRLSGGPDDLFTEI